MQLTFERADLDDDELLDFLRGHLDDIAPTAPTRLQQPLDGTDIRLWVARLNGVVVATGAIKVLQPGHIEIKSMRTDPSLRGQGIGARILEMLLEDARSQGAQQIWLEAGAADYYIPARALYERAGFVECGPFGDLSADADSIFMSKQLSAWPPTP